MNAFSVSAHAIDEDTLALAPDLWTIATRDKSPMKALIVVAKSTSRNQHRVRLAVDALGVLRQAEPGVHELDRAVLAELGLHVVKHGFELCASVSLGLRFLPAFFEALCSSSGDVCGFLGGGARRSERDGASRPARSLGARTERDRVRRSGRRAPSGVDGPAAGSGTTVRARSAIVSHRCSIGSSRPQDTRGGISDLTGAMQSSYRDNPQPGSWAALRSSPPHASESIAASLLAFSVS
jgi:hypothetical protein